MANQQKLVSGQQDTPLTEKGRYQAQWLCDVLKNERLSAIYASSLGRAMETARPTAEHHRIEVQVSDDLKEIHFGELQGKPLDEKLLSEAEPKPMLLQARCVNKESLNLPGSEHFFDFKRRITECLELLLQQLPDCALIVGHRNTNEVILCRLLGLNRTINVKNKYIYEIELGDKPSIDTIRLGGEFHGKRYAGLKDD